MKIIVGSTALAYFNLNRRKLLDIDYWYTSDEASPGGDSVVVPADILELVEHTNGYATPEAIYTIKLSHSIYDIHWQKTKLDILHLYHCGCKVLPGLYEKLKEHWKQVHGSKSFLSLNKTKDEFFTDNVSYIYDHDYLHELVAHPNEPIYKSCLKDGHDVLIDKAKFNAVPLMQRVEMLREEITVIAAERWLIDPRYRGKISWYRAYMFSLRKTVTTLTKGDYSYFIMENLRYFVKPSYGSFKHLIETLELE